MRWLTWLAIVAISVALVFAVLPAHFVLAGSQYGDPSLVANVAYPGETPFPGPYAGQGSGQTGNPFFPSYMGLTVLKRTPNAGSPSTDCKSDFWAWLGRAMAARFGITFPHYFVLGSNDGQNASHNSLFAGSMDLNQSLTATIYMVADGALQYELNSGGNYTIVLNMQRYIRFDVKFTFLGSAATGNFWKFNLEIDPGTDFVFSSKTGVYVNDYLYKYLTNFPYNGPEIDAIWIGYWSYCFGIWHDYDDAYLREYGLLQNSALAANIRYQSERLLESLGNISGVMLGEIVDPEFADAAERLAEEQDKADQVGEAIGDAQGAAFDKAADDFGAIAGLADTPASLVETFKWTYHRVEDVFGQLGDLKYALAFAPLIGAAVWALGMSGRNAFPSEEQLEDRSLRSMDRGDRVRERKFERDHAEVKARQKSGGLGF